MKALEAINITKKYQGRDVISNINISLEEGETVCLVGSSGVGKTTLFQTLSGLTKPDAGSVLLHGKDVTGKTGEVGYMLQKDLLLPHFTISENVALPLRIKKMNKLLAIEKGVRYFEQFGLSGYENAYPSQLSGGMRQRAALLRTYLFGKDVILLDEPFSALDELTRADMWDWYLKISAELKLSTIFISHSIEEAVFLSNRVYVMAGHPGKIEGEIEISEKVRNSDFRLSKEMQEYKRKILEDLGKTVVRDLI